MESFQGIAWLKQQLGEGCEEVPVQGDQPLLLDDPRFAYVTLSEHHQLFCVSYQDGKAVGRREHVALCRPGQLLFGLTPSAGTGATALILSGITGSVVWRIATARLFGLMRQPGGAAIIAQLFDGWIRLLVDTLPRAPMPTKHHALGVGERVEVDSVPPPSSYALLSVSAYFRVPDLSDTALRVSEQGAYALSAAEGLVWVRPPVPPKGYGGIELSAEAASADYWPLTEQAWLLCEGGPLVAMSTEELLVSAQGTVFADRFYQFVVSVVARRRARLAEARVDRDVATRRAERVAVSEAFGKLAQVGSGRRLDPQLGGVGAFDQVCRLIAHHLGVDAPGVVSPEGPSLAQMQVALSLMTGIRTRSVLLEGDWYRHESGPLLGFLLTGDEEAVHPVAILPSRGGYVVHDPERRKRWSVDAARAESLHPQAYQFYPPAPITPMGPLDVLRFASRGAISDVAFVILIGLFAGWITTLVPLLTGQIFDRIIPGAEKTLLRDITLVLLIVYVSQSLFELARGFVMVRAQTRMDTTLEAGVWDRLLSLPLPFFRKYAAGDLAARAAGIGAIREVLTGATMSVLFSGLFSVWNFALLFYIDATLALAATGLVAIASAVASIAAYYGLKRQRTVAAIDGKIHGLVLQLFGGIAKLRVTRAENRAFGVWAALFASRRDADLGAEHVNIRVGAFQATFPTLSSMTLFFLLTRSGEQSLSTGQFLAFSTAFGLFLRAVLDVIETALHSLNVVPMYERAKPILTGEVESHGRGEGRTEIGGAIEVSHLSFRYQPESPLVLDDVNVRIEPKEFVAIVGPSGSGKSTLLRILLGFEEPTEGGVFFDGQALSSLDVRQVRQQLGVVLQNSRVTAGDIFSNIVGNTGRSLDDAWRAARAAAIDKDIEAMPMGMHTVVSQGGGMLSGGQRQRLLIARALATSPKILFFDEATSALDNVTQAAVSESLEVLRVTRIVIAHRLSTIQQADKIIVLKDGKVVEIGRYDELMARQGEFHALAARQTV